MGTGAYSINFCSFDLINHCKFNIIKSAPPQNTEEVLDCLRACNVAARWLMLHATGRHPRLAPAVAERMPRPATVVSFVMDTALLEFEVRQTLKSS